MVDDLGTSGLRLERDGPIAWCVIDRPAARNALTPAMYYGVKCAVIHPGSTTHQGNIGSAEDCER